jgi:hypothetical protein
MLRTSFALSYFAQQFYNFDSAAVGAMLNPDESLYNPDNDEYALEFPFSVTELEHEIINLQPNPKRSLLLLGRSGTGKTTCLVFRMWWQFRNYWVNNSRFIDKSTGEVAYAKRMLAAESKESFDSGGDVADNGKEEKHSATEENGQRDMDHLHTVFLTRNPVLRDEVRKCFNAMRKCDDAVPRLPVVEDVEIAPGDTDELEIGEEDEQEDEGSTSVDAALQYDALQDVPDFAYPIFASAKDWLWMLDNSLGVSEECARFFKEGTDRADADTWDAEAGGLLSIDMYFEEDSEYAEDGGTEDGGGESSTWDQESAEAHKSLDIKAFDAEGAGFGSGIDGSLVGGEVTYNKFVEMWPKIVTADVEGHGREELHPSLVYTEIKSYIKGSVEALQSDGPLSLDAYQALGRKRSVMSSSQRERVFRMFKKYERERQRRRCWDEGDLVLNLYRRLCKFGRPAGVALHQIVADEVQDFTQAEIQLLIYMCQNPNDLVLAGDTAQNINRGVGFRFADIKTLFHQADISLQQQLKSEQKNENSLHRIQDPMWLELRFNYRSHSGILNVAAAVCELLYHFFKGSLDRLPADTGLFDGPKPVLLNLNTVDELVLLLLGNQRTTTQIEFGAQQVVLVRNEDAREALPEDLRAGLVMTVFEAKGLEFDDVILYNFFADSPAEKEWICVNGYNDEEQEVDGDGSNKTSGSGMLHEVAWSELEGHQSQPSKEAESEVATSTSAKSSSHRKREFNTEADRLLNSELKHLYTAVTRPRVNLWIFDEHKERRGPMFRFMKRRGLCEMIDDLDNATEEGVELFAKTSTAEDWLKQGRYFLQKRSSVDDKKAALAIAVKCFKKAADKNEDCSADALAMLYNTEARIKMIEANEVSDKTGGKRQTKVGTRHSALLSAALACMRAGAEDRKMSQSAAVHLLRAREFAHAAAIFKGLQMFENASKAFADAGDVDSAVGCAVQMRSAKGVRKAIQLLRGQERFDDAIAMVQEHWDLSWDPLGRTVKLEELARISARWWNQRDDEAKMKIALEHLPVEQQLQVLCKSKRFTAAVDLLEREGDHEKAAEILLENGQAGDAAEYMLKYLPKNRLVGRCYLVEAEKHGKTETEQDGTWADDESKPKSNWADDRKRYQRSEELCRKALKVFEEAEDCMGRADANELLGRLYAVQVESISTSDADRSAAKPFVVKHLQQAMKLYRGEKQACGVEQCLRTLQKHEQVKERNKNKRIELLKWTVEHLRQLAMALLRTGSVGRAAAHLASGYKYFGLSKNGTDPTKLQIEKHVNVRFSSLLKDEGAEGDLVDSQRKASTAEIPKMKAHQLIAKSATKSALKLLTKMLLECRKTTNSAKVERSAWHNAEADQEQLKSRLQHLELELHILADFDKFIATTVDVASLIKQHGIVALINDRKVLAKDQTRVLEALTVSLQQPDIKQYGLVGAQMVQEYTKELPMETRKQLLNHHFAVYRASKPYEKVGSAAVTVKLWGSLSRLAFDQDKDHDRYTTDALRLLKDAEKQLMKKKKKGATWATQGLIGTKRCACTVPCDSFQCCQPQSFCRNMHTATTELHSHSNCLHYVYYTLTFLHTAATQQSTLPPMMETIELLEAQLVALLGMGRSVDTWDNQQNVFLPKSYANWHLKQPRSPLVRAIIRSAKSISAADILKKVTYHMKGLCAVLPRVNVLSMKLNDRGVSNADAWERGLVLALTILCNTHGGLRSSAIQLVSIDSKAELVGRLRHLGRALGVSCYSFSA